MSNRTVVRRILAGVAAIALAPFASAAAPVADDAAAAAMALPAVVTPYNLVTSPAPSDTSRSRRYRTTCVSKLPSDRSEACQRGSGRPRSR